MAQLFTILSAEDLSRRKTKRLLGLYKQWTNIGSKNSNLEELNNEELDACLAQFYGEIRKQDGKEYEPDSL